MAADVHKGIGIFTGEPVLEIGMTVVVRFQQTCFAEGEFAKETFAAGFAGVFVVAGFAAGLTAAARGAVFFAGCLAGAGAAFSAAGVEVGTFTFLMEGPAGASFAAGAAAGFSSFTACLRKVIL